MRRSLPQPLLLLISVAVWFGLPGQIPHVYATLYYVAATGKDRHPGTPSSPFRTLQRAADAVRPGDTVLVRTGIYTENVRLKTSGTASAPITFKPEPGSGSVVLRSALTSQEERAVFDVVDTSYNRIEGFDFRDFKYGWAIRLVSTEHRHDATPHRATGNVISGNRFRNIGTPHLTASSQVNSTIAIYYAGPDNIIEDNILMDNYGRSIQCFGCFGNTVRRNRITGVKAKAVSWSSTPRGVGIWFGGEDKRLPKAHRIHTTGTGNTISDNTIHSFSDSDQHARYNGIWCDVNGDRNHVLRNVVHGTRGRGIFIESRCDDNVIEQNIVFDNVNGGFVTPGYKVRPAIGNRWINNVAFMNNHGGFAFRNSWGNIVKNNIGYNNKDSQVFVSQVSAQKGDNTFSHNLWYADRNPHLAIWGHPHKDHWDKANLTFSEWLEQSGERHGLSANPLFQDTQSVPKDFTLQPSSPARGAGEGGIDLGAHPGRSSSGGVTRVQTGQ